MVSGARECVRALPAYSHRLYDARVTGQTPDFVPPPRNLAPAQVDRTPRTAIIASLAAHALIVVLVIHWEFESDVHPTKEGSPPLEVDIITDVLQVAPPIDQLTSLSGEEPTTPSIPSAQPSLEPVDPQPIAPTSPATSQQSLPPPASKESAAPEVVAAALPPTTEGPVAETPLEMKALETAATVVPAVPAAGDAPIPTPAASVKPAPTAEALVAAAPESSLRATDAPGSFEGIPPAGSLEAADAALDVAESVGAEATVPALGVPEDARPTVSMTTLQATDDTSQAASELGPPSPTNEADGPPDTLPPAPGQAAVPATVVSHAAVTATADPLPTDAAVHPAPLTAAEAEGAEIAPPAQETTEVTSAQDLPESVQPDELERWRLAARKPPSGLSAAPGESTPTPVVTDLSAAPNVDDEETTTVIDMVPTDERELVRPGENPRQVLEAAASAPPLNNSSEGEPVTSPATPVSRTEDSASLPSQIIPAADSPPPLSSNDSPRADTGAPGPTAPVVAILPGRDRINSLQPHAVQPVAPDSPTAAASPRLPSQIATAETNLASSQPIQPLSIQPSDSTPVGSAASANVAAPSSPIGDVAVAVPPRDVMQAFDPDQEIRNTLGQYGCARITSRYALSKSEVLLSGHVQSEADLRDLLAKISATAGVKIVDSSDLYVVGEPYCRVLTFLSRSDMTRSDEQREVIASIGQPAQSGVLNLFAGMPIEIDLRAPDFSAYIYVDYYTSDGKVFHLLPAPGLGQELFRPDQRFELGGASDVGRRLTVAPPFGLDMVVALGSSKPLFDKERPAAETSAGYIAALDSVIDRAKAADPDLRLEYAYHLIFTSASPTQ